MAILIPDIPTSIRKPGKYFTFNTATALRNSPSNLQKVLLIGQRLAAGTVLAKVPTDIYSDDDAATFFGAGSVLHLMARAAIRANGYVYLTAIALDDAAASVAATGQVVITGPATSTGVARLWVGNQKVEAAVNAADTATVIGASLVAAAANIPSLPVTLVNTLGTLALTAKNKGALGNQILISFETTGAAGVAGAVTAMATGATNPNIQDALDVVAAERYHINVSAYNDSTSLQALRDQLATNGGPLEQRGEIGVAAVVGAVAASTTLAAAINGSRVVAAEIRGVKSLPWEIAAAMGAAKGYIEDPAYNLDDLPLKGIDAPAVSDRFTRTEQETMLANGVTPLYVMPGEIVGVVRMVTTYTVNSQAIADPSLLDITTITSLDYFRDDVRQRLSLRFPHPKATARLPLQVIAEVIDVMRIEEQLEILRDVDYWKTFVTAEYDLVDNTRLDIKIPAPVVPGAHIFAGELDLVLYSVS